MLPVCKEALYGVKLQQIYSGIYSMPTYRKRGNSWEVQVCHKGIRRTATKPSKTAATLWASQTIAEIDAGQSRTAIDKPFSALLERYRDEVSVTKRGARWETLRIGLLLRDEIAKVRLPVLSSIHFADWRDRRLKQVSPASVLREWTLLNHALGIAIREWQWLTENPMKPVRRPPSPRSRDRRISQDEIDRLCFALGYDKAGKPETATARVGAAFLFAIETAMRAGEIAGIHPGHIRGTVVDLPITKNGSARSVPLSTEARRILDQLPQTEGPVFGLTTAQIDALFRKAKGKALIQDLHFHDTRHEAITRLSKKLDVLDLARMVGIRDLRILMVYYNAKAEEIATQLG